MSDVIISPNMSLPVPIVGQDPGPDWANNLNSCLGILDQHNHSPGQGVQIVPSSININADLPFNDNNITLLKTVNFQPQPSPLAGAAPNLGAIYVSGNELYYNDEAGNVVQITKTGSVNSGAGSITGLPSGTASASYSAGSQTFVWESATLTPANMDFASAIFRNLAPSSFGLTLNPPNAMGADYSVTLPPPNSSGSTAFLTYDTSNNIGVGPSVATFNANAFNPPGAVIMFGGTSSPTGYLICDGSAISRVTFATLFSAIGTAYGTGDGTTTFNIPDFRGIFPRGVDNGAGNDPDTLTRTAVNGGNTGDNVGSIQGYENAAHAHQVTVDVGAGLNLAIGGGTGAPWWVAGANDTAPSIVGSSQNTGSSGGNETRPINLYVNFIIKT